MAGITALSLLLGIFHCESFNTERAESSVSVQSASHAALSGASLESPEQCGSESGDSSSHCAVHCHHCGAVVASVSAIRPDLVPAFVSLESTGNISGCRNNSFRPPISA